MAPPLGSIIVTSSRREGMAPLHGTTTGGPPLGSYILQIVRPLLVSPVVENRGASPYFNFIHRIPTGRPTWDSRHGGHGGASPYFRNFSFYYQVHTSHKSRDWGASPSLRIVYAAGRGWRPSALSRAQEQ